MKMVVITGSTRGLGFGLADAFLELGCSVTISGRTHEPVQRAAAQLSAKYAADRVLGHPCDVRIFEQVQALWAAAQAHWGRVDIWINNAGISHQQKELWEHKPQELAAVVETNLLGTLYGSKVALEGMLQQGFGSLYNMEGLGSDGRQVKGLALYGSTKRAIHYLNRALAEETEGTAVLVGALSPGMVTTDMLTTEYVDSPEDWEAAKRIFNILADRVETVTPWLARQILDNTKNGAHFKWLGRGKTMARFLMAPFRRRDLFEDEDSVPG
jgi:NAD(P)-dependent dehydrogenase (short-subunit alcohol dehydrogenase family)